MRLVSMIVGAGIIAAAATAAYADSLTSRVLEWNPAKSTITFADRTQMQVSSDLVPADLQPGDEVTVLFNSDEDGVSAVYGIVINKPISEGEDAEGAE